MHEYACASFKTLSRPPFHALARRSSGPATIVVTTTYESFRQLPLVVRISTSKRDVRGFSLLNQISLTSFRLNPSGFVRRTQAFAMSTPEDTEKDGKRQRRSHRKSRHGCVECKQRKIKCDETWPICLNCVKRDVICSSPSRPLNNSHSAARTGASCSDDRSRGTVVGHYRRGLRFVPSAYTSDSSSADVRRRTEPRPTTPSHAISNLKLLCGRSEVSESPPRPLSSNPLSLPLSYADLELWHHYILLTSGTVSEWSDGSDNHFWRVEFPEMGFKSPHILHLLLGLGALHKARVNPAHRNSLLSQADSHHAIGMRGATKMLQAMAPEDFQTAFASSSLISLFSLGKGPREGEYIGFNDVGDGSFLTFLRGVQCINELQKAPNSDDQSTIDTKRQYGPYNCPLKPDTSYGVHVQYLWSIATAITDPSDVNCVDVYLEALASLGPFLSSAFEDKGILSASDPHSRIPFAWLYRLSDHFLDRLHRKVPLALAIFACWAVVLGELETSWITKGWPEHIVSAIWEFLGAEHKDLLSWPMSHMCEKDSNQEDRFPSESPVESSSITLRITAI